VIRALLRLALLFAVLLLVPSSSLPTAHAAAGSGYTSVRLFGIDYVDAQEFGRRFGLTPQWLVAKKKLRLRSEWTTIDFTIHDADIQLNRLRVFLAEPVVAHRNSLYISRRDAEQLLSPILRPARTPVPRLKTIVIDAGHGGHDPGNQNSRLKLQEKRMTLDVAKRLERLLRAAGYRVVQTRKSDRYVDYDDRTALIAKSRADLFISIHFNGFTDRAVAGTETYILTPRYQRSSPQAERDRKMVTTAYPGNRHDHWNTLLGYHMHRQLVERLDRHDRGLKRFRYRVLRNATCPAVLVEAAFLSNDTEGRQVATPAYRQKIAAAIAAGVNAHAAALKRMRS
jgi:N-acetylmuramoyl-L-alanine amidase